MFRDLVFELDGEGGCFDEGANLLARRFEGVEIVAL